LERRRTQDRMVGIELLLDWMATWNDASKTDDHA